MLKHLGGAIVMQEVPDEITLAVNVSGCTHRCPECHSKYLWEDKGILLDNEWIQNMLKQYKRHVTCVCFMGGDHEQYELLDMCQVIHKVGVKTCLYSGVDSVTDIIQPLQNELDYLKIGSYIPEYGPLNKNTTNQKMFKKIDDEWVDITHKFWKEDTNG